MQEFRFHGRGGQGVVVLGKLAARLFFQLGKHVKEFPKFGVERRGAPVEEYVRVDEEPIDLSCQVYTPNSVVVMAEALLDAVDVTAGLEAGSLILVNSRRPAEELGARLAGFRVATVDADAIALGRGLGTPLAPIANTTLFGAFARLLDSDLSQVDDAIRALIKKSAPNIESAHDAYAAVGEPQLLPGAPVVRPARALPFGTMAELPDHAYSFVDGRGNKTGSWRSQRPELAFKVAPCNARCPAGNDVRGFLEAMAGDAMSRALEILLDTSPLPAVCGRVCPHPCEDQCNREPMDGAVAVRSLERYAAAHGDVQVQAAPSTGRRVAIVGSGPAGLSAAWQLARLGHAVVLYEAAPEPGGMLTLGIPSFRLPRDVLQRDIDRILALGVELRCSEALGDTIELDELRDRYDAVLLAVGQMASTGLRASGADLPGVQQGLPFLRDHNLGHDVHVGDKLVVIGGGNTAVDVAGVALRTSKTRDVTIVYRRTRDQMPAIPEEVEQVIAEGAKLVELVAPIELVAGADGRVSHLVCDKMQLGDRDASGRPRPVPIEGSRHTIECDHVILAIGQRTDLEFAGDLSIDSDQIRTNQDKVYVCGDASTGAGTVTAAIGSGRIAALALHSALGGEVAEPKPTWAPRTDAVLRFDRINPNHFAARPSTPQPRLSVDKRLSGLSEVVGEILDGHAEAMRCLSCGTCTACDNCYTYCPEPAVSRNNGVYRFELEYCKGCGICFEECPRGVIDMREDA
jgi:2-oxoacid:acceptor oxidoreductase gamma subunit (pyruvate/2-ketoisovalerate family)